MTWATSTSDQPSGMCGDVRFVESAERAELEAMATRTGLLLVPVEPPRPALRGRLALLIESAVEEQLESRGAPPPGVGASSDLDASLSDQLYRARLVGSSGLAISLYTLEGIANLAGAIDAEDSAVLRWWLAATRERPVHLYLATSDRTVGVYGEPVAMASLLSSRTADSSNRAHGSPNAAPEVRYSAETMDLSEVPPAVAEVARRIVVNDDDDELTPSPTPVTCEPVNDAEALMQAMAAIFADETTPSEGVPAVTADGPDAFDPGPPRATLPASERVDASDFEIETPSGEVVSMTPPSVEDFCSPPTPEVTSAQPSASPEPAAVALLREAETLEPPPKKSRPPLDPNAAVEWRRWVQELESTRGPKPLAVVERTFVSAYVPLTDALARGLAGAEAEPIADAWAKSFARSYSEAFDALRLRGKRPTMVLDIPDLAMRIGRLHGARSAQLILVDGMRFDLGLRVNERLRPLLGQRAALTERLLLWSALPTTTAMQLELIGRGPQGLKEVTEQTDSEIPVARGRAAATLRRIRAGHREVLKLDLIESAMSVPGGPLAERLDDLADEAAEALAGHLLRLPPRTLALVFGDHGFSLDQVGGGTSAGRSGGASPEEVLVPAFAWLVGAVH